MTDADLAALLAGTADAAPGLRPVADVLAALTAEATSGELAGEDRVMAEFRRRAGAPEPRAARARTTGLTSRLGTKVAAAAAGIAVVLAGAATAAFANVLPAPIQRFAHEIIGAPSPRAQQGTPNRGRPAPAIPASPGQSLAHEAPRAGQHPSPHATAPGNPHATAPGSPHGKGGTGNPHAHGKHGNPHGSGKHGNGRGQGGGGQGNNGHGQGNNGHGRGSNQRRGGSPHATAHRAAHPARPARGKPGTT